MSLFFALASWRLGCSPGRQAVLMLVVFMTAACLGPRFSVDVEAPSEELRREIAAYAEHIIPELEAEFGVRSRPLRIVLDPAPSPRGLGGETGSSGITLYPIAIPWILGVLAHEAVHWLLHWHDSYWNALPIVLEEGLAHLAFHRYSNTEVTCFSLSYPQIRQLLQLSHEEYKSLSESRVATYTGVYIVRLLGLEGIRELVQRARKAGHEKVPAPWIIDAIIKADPARVEEARRPTLNP